MDIEELHHYQELESDIKNLIKIKESLYYNIHSPVSSESHSSTPGDPTEQAVKQIARYNGMIDQKELEKSVLSEKITKWTWTIDNLDIRAIVNWHYLKGLSWKATARKMYGYRSSDNCRKRFYRFMRDQKN